MPNHPQRLNKGKEYIIVKADNGKIYRGIHTKIYRGIHTKMKGIFIGMKVDWYEHLFMYYDDFYDVEEIRKKSNNARQCMEQRALNLVLKRLVNETFEW